MLKDLTTVIVDLENRLSELKKQPHQREGWLDTAHTYGKDGPIKRYRFRWFDEHKKRSRNISADEHRQIKRELEKGKVIIKLETQLARLQSKRDRLERKIKAMGGYVKNPQGTCGSNDEWSTPPELIESARRVLGRIDLDPASNDLAQTWIKAGQFCTIEDDGLTTPWFGRVWCNPPYGNMTKKFVQRAIALYKADKIESAILLINRTGAAWFVDLEDRLTAVCKVKKRIAFFDLNGVQQGSPRYYNDFLYLGPNPDDFKAEFAQYGRVY